MDVMTEISAAAVKALRDRTGLPMMECKRALAESGGDAEKAIEYLRKAGKKTMESRAGRETSEGRIAVFASLDRKVGAMIELLCESAPVANNEEFIALAQSLATQLAQGPGAKTPEELYKQPCPGQEGRTLEEVKDDLANRIREVFKLTRILRIDGPCGGYAHHNGALGVLLEVSGGMPEIAKDICMHVAALRPAALATADLDPALIAKEREILTEAARREGKPENIIAKMVEGRLKNFYAEKVLLEQPFVKDDKRTVGAVARQAGMEIKRFVLWQLGKA